MLTDDQKKIIQKNKINAMKRRLNSYDVCQFDKVPDFIIESFFNNSSYRKRLFVAEFAYLNGIQLDDLFKLIQWSSISRNDVKKITALYEIYFEDETYRRKYYSYCTIRNVVSFLDGTLRRYGTRKE